MPTFGLDFCELPELSVFRNVSLPVLLHTLENIIFAVDIQTKYQLIHTLNLSL